MELKVFKGFFKKKKYTHEEIEFHNSIQDCVSRKVLGKIPDKLCNFMLKSNTPIMHMHAFQI